MPGQPRSINDDMKYDVIYVSPHLDDVAFSCATHIRRQRRQGKRVLVVSIFTKGAEVADDSARGALQHSLNPYSAIEARLEEDAACMQELDVDWHYADFQELVFRHNVWDKSTCLPARLAKAFCGAWCSFQANRMLVWHISQYLRRLLTKSKCQWIVGPAAIGMHPDHLLVYRACCQVRDSVKSWFYYDFPYCSYAALKYGRLAMLHWQPLRHIELQMDAEEREFRKHAVCMYESQIEPVFGSKAHAEALLSRHPQERFFEQPRLTGDHSPEEMEESLDKCIVIENTVGAFALWSIILFDSFMSFFAFIYVHRRIIGDEDHFSLYAQYLAYSVIACSIVRATLLLRTETIDLAWVCILSMCLIAWALSTTAWKGFNYDEKTGYRELLTLCSYYTLQMWVCLLQAVVCCAKSNDTKAYVSKSKGPMKIMVITDYMPPQTHGISTHSDGIVSALREADHDVHVYTTCGKADKLRHLLWSFTNPWNGDVRISWCPSFELLWAIGNKEADVIHIIMPNIIVWPVLLVAWLRGVPTYCSHHCREDIATAYLSNAIVRNIVVFGYVIGAMVPCYLFSTMNAALTYGFTRSHYMLNKMSPRRVAIIPSSMNAKLFDQGRFNREQVRHDLCAQLQICESAKLWLVVSRLAPEKELHDVLEALEYHTKTWPEEAVHLLVAGDGPSRAELEKQAASQGLPVHFLGMYPHDRTPMLYVAADVCVTCSVKETFGLTVLEALACGVPKVMPHCEVFDELWAEVLGDWMYTKGDAVSLASTMRYASQTQCRQQLQALHDQNAFGPDIFWSWTSAAAEQCLQYRRAIRTMRETRRFVFAVCRLLLIITSMGIAFLVTVRSVCPAAKELYLGYVH